MVRRILTILFILLTCVAAAKEYKDFSTRQDLPDTARVLTYDDLSGYRAITGKTIKEALGIKLDTERFLNYSGLGRVSPNDPRLTDARMPLAHTQDMSTINGLEGALEGKEPAIGVKGSAFNKDFGSESGTVAEGNDPRLSDARTPLAHTQGADTITGLSVVALSGSYSDLTNQPTIPNDATQIAYNGSTVQAALDELMYVPISITSFTLSGSASNVTQELGSTYTITGSGLAWATNKTATTQTINGTPRTSPWMPTSPVSTNQTYALQVGDGRTTASSTRTITFTHKRYWGVSSSAVIDDAGIIALSSEFSTSRTQTRTLTALAQYLYIVYVDTAGAASFTVNGFADTSWQLTQRSFTNASGYTTTFRIYRSANQLTGTYTVGVS